MSDESLTVCEEFINVLFECVLVAIVRVSGQRFKFVFFARMIQRRVQRTGAQQTGIVVGRF